MAPMCAEYTHAVSLRSDFLLQTMLCVFARVMHLVKSAAVLTWYAVLGGPPQARCCAWGLMICMKSNSRSFDAHTKNVCVQQTAYPRIGSNMLFAELSQCL